VRGENEMWRTEKSKLDQRTRALAARSLNRLTGLTGQHYIIPRSLWRHESTTIKCNGVILVLAAIPGYRPSRRLLVGIDPLSDRSLLPSEITKDLLEIADALGISSGCACALVHWEYGLVVKKSEPILVDSLEVARQLEIEQAYRKAEATYPGKEFWWHRWGGDLYLLDLDAERVVYHPIETDIGNLEPMPIR
jgi:hypothetical protein